MKNNDNKPPNLKDLRERLMRMAPDERLKVIDAYLHARRLLPAQRKRLIETLLFAKRVEDHVKEDKYPMPKGKPPCPN